MSAGLKKGLFFNCEHCKKNGHNEKYCRLKRRQPQQELQQHANVIEEDKDEEKHLFMALQTVNTSKRKYMAT